MDIAITTEDDTICKVSKFSNDEGKIKFFVYNNGSQEDDKYGRFLLIMEDGIYTQNDDWDVVQVSLKEGALLICEESDFDPVFMILAGILSSVQKVV